MKPLHTLALAFAIAAPTWAQPGHEGHDHAPGEGHKHERAAKSPDEETNSDYFWRKSDEAFHAGDYERAIGNHKAIVALDPSDVESFSVAAWLMWSLGKKDESNAHIARGLAANPQNWEMFDAAAQHYDLQKNPAQSREYYAKAVELAGKDAPQMLRRRFAHASEKAGDLGGSVAVWEGLVKDFPTEAVNQNNLKRVQELKGKKDQTIAVAALGAVGILGLVPVWRKRG